MDKKVIHTVFEEMVKRQPSAMAIECADRRITYGQLNRYANRLAYLLTTAGCRPGTIVHVVAPPSIELVGALLAVFKAGGIYLPVDLSFAEKKLRQVFEKTFDGFVVVAAGAKDTLLHVSTGLDIKIRHLIVARPWGDEGGTAEPWGDEGGTATRGGEAGGIAELERDADGTADPVVEVSGGSANYIFYTSGSTGEAKAIMGMHASLSHFIHWQIKEFGIDSSVRVSQLTQVTFDASLRDIFVALIAGGTLCIPTQEVRENPIALLKWLERSAVSLVHCVPSLFRVLTREWQLEPAGSMFRQQVKKW